MWLLLAVSRGITVSSIVNGGSMWNKSFLFLTGVLAGVWIVR